MLKNKKQSNFTNIFSFISNSNLNTKIEKDNWKLILSRKGPIQYAHKLASEHIKNKKPVTLTVMNEILAYCNISITEEILNSLINAPSIIIKKLD